MELDEEYKNRLLDPLKNRVGVKISAYLSSLKNSGVSVEDNGIVNEKFIAHFQQLVREGLITNSSGKLSLESFGIEVGTNGHITHWDCSDIMAPPSVERSLQVSNTINIGGSYRGNLQAGISNEISEIHDKNKSQWFLDNIREIVVGVLVIALSAISLAWLGVG